MSHNQKYKTHWLPFGRFKNSSSFLVFALIYFILTGLIKRFYIKRTIEGVKESYDLSRGRMSESLESITWNEYIYGDLQLSDFILVDNRISFDHISIPRKVLLSRIDKVMHKIAATSSGTVIEVGSGDGRNILYLRKKYPYLQFVGYELSPVSVALSRAAAKKYNIDGIEFIVADATTELPAHHAEGPILLLYSSYALEMIPRKYPKAIDNMLKLSANYVAFFEPIDDLWKSNLLGLASKARVFSLDRLHNMGAYIHKIPNRYGYKVISSHCSGVAINPLNEMVEIILEKS